MTTLMLWSSLCTAGLVLALRGALPPAPSLLDALDRGRSRPAAGVSVSTIRSFQTRIGLWLINTFQTDRLPRMEADLAITESSLEVYAADKLTSAAGVGAVVAAVGSLLGFLSGAPALVVAFAVGACGGFLIPDLDLTSKAARRRREFADALTSFVSLVAVCVAGGGGANSAVSDALGVGSTWPFAMLADTVQDSTLRGEDLLTGLDRLGRRIDSEALIDLAGAIGLAGSSGARLTDTLRSRAETSRDAARQSMLTAAEQRSERLNIPVAVMALVWMLFVGFPAVSRMIGG